MKQVLFATSNPAKIKVFKERIEKRGIKLLTRKDITVPIADQEETGISATQNAYIKAKAYYDSTKIISIGMDNCLYFPTLPENEQPATHVKRVNGKELTYKQMQEYYANVAKEHGGRIEAYWFYGLCIYDGKTRKDITWKSENFYISSTPYGNMEEGYPIDSLSISKKYNKYWYELTKEELDEDRKASERGKENAADEIAKYLEKYEV